MSPEDQQKQKDQIKTIVEQAKTDINSVQQSETEPKDQINGKRDQAVDKFSAIKDQAALAGQKTKAEGILKDKQTKAHNIIDQSQLTAKQKKAAKAAIDDAYQQSFQDIEKITAISNIPDEATIGQNIDRLLTKPETSTEPKWFNDEQKNAFAGG